MHRRVDTLQLRIALVLGLKDIDQLDDLIERLFNGFAPYPFAISQLLGDTGDEPADGFSGGHIVFGCLASLLRSVVRGGRREDGDKGEQQGRGGHEALSQTRSPARQGDKIARGGVKRVAELPERFLGQGDLRPGRYEERDGAVALLPTLSLVFDGITDAIEVAILLDNDPGAASS